MRVIELWKEFFFDFVHWKHSVIRSNQLINFSHFTVVFVPVFHLPFYHYGKKSKVECDEKMQLACKSLDVVIIFRFSKRKIWKRKKEQLQFHSHIFILNVPVEALLSEPLETRPHSLLVKSWTSRNVFSSIQLQNFTVRSRSTLQNKMKLPAYF